MFRKLNDFNDWTASQIRIRDASFPAPFVSGLEYNAPARGPWNIVHTGMLLPESHQIFVCARGCLRGVVLTAAEMNAMNRMSWVSVSENDLFDGSMEQNIIDGTADVLRKLPALPRAVLLFVSCIHLFAGCDLERVLNELSRQFPGVDFVDCYMNPTMRKNGLTPDQLMRRQLYAALKPRTVDPKAVNIVGNDRPPMESSELVRMIREAGFTLRDVTLCRTYDEYLAMAEGFLNITTYLPAAAGAETLSARLGTRYLSLPFSFSPDEIRRGYASLASALGMERAPAFEAEEARAFSALRHARAEIGDTPVEIDYTAFPRPLGLARLLIGAGFRVRTVYADVFTPEERDDFEYLRAAAPDLMLRATVHAKMRFAAQTSAPGTEKVLAVGQKAAYFSSTRHFVNIVAGGGLYGFDGIARTADLLLEAFREEKETEIVIQHKGWGCESCL